MEPRIQYARTADGVSIAFWTLGKGLPLVSYLTLLADGFGLQLDLQVQAAAEPDVPLRRAE